MLEKKCKNCLCFDREKEICKVNLAVSGKVFHLPVFPEDDCHLIELNIEVDQVRWWVEDETGKPADKGIVKVEYPKNLFT